MVKKVVEVPSLKIGERVSFRGHILTILDIKANGYIEAWSPTFHVTTDDPSRFLKEPDLNAK